MVIYTLMQYTVGELGDMILIVENRGHKKDYKNLDRPYQSVLT